MNNADDWTPSTTYEIELAKLGVFQFNLIYKWTNPESTTDEIYQEMENYEPTTSIGSCPARRRDVLFYGDAGWSRMPLFKRKINEHDRATKKRSERKSRLSGRREDTTKLVAEAPHKNRHHT